MRLSFGKENNMLDQIFQFYKKYEEWTFWGRLALLLYTNLDQFEIRKHIYYSSLSVWNHSIFSMHFEVYNIRTLENCLRLLWSISSNFHNLLLPSVGVRVSQVSYLPGQLRFEFSRKVLPEFSAQATQRLRWKLFLDENL